MPRIVLERPKLLARLNAALRTEHVLITAPAGYGKSLLLRTLVAGRPRSAYLPLTPAFADLPYLQAQLAPLLKTHATLVLDDVHHVTNSPDVTSWLLDQLATPAPALILSGRHMPFPDRALPPRPITRLHASDLAFTLAETRAVLGAMASFSQDQISAWHQRTQGWPLAVALVAQQADEALDLGDTALFAHLAHTVLADLPGDLRRYILVTGLALRFNDELAAALLANSGLGPEVQRLRGEVERRNFFLEPAGRPGWFRYHDLIQEFLRQRASDDMATYVEQIVSWFESHGDLEMAIEQALAGKLEQRAADLIARVPPEQVRRECRYLTYRRWLHGLAPATLDSRPALRLQLGTFLHSVQGFREEAWQQVRLAGASAARSQDAALARTVRVHSGFMYYREGDYARALAIAGDLLADPACQDRQRALALRLASVVLSETGRFHEARGVFNEAMALAVRLDNQDELHFTRNNLALTVLIPLGELSEAAQHLEAELSHFSGSPGLRIRSLTAWCDLCTARGDWPGLAAAIAEWQGLQAQMEVVETGDRLWLSFYAGVLAVGQRWFPAAWGHVAEMRALAGSRPLAVLSLAWLETRLLRLEGRLEEAAAHATAFLAQPGQPLYWRSSLALDRDIAQGLGAGDCALHRETRFLMGWRARAELLRLRALLAVICWRRQDPRWRRHACAALVHLRRPEYPAILTRRDPDLGAAFWRVLLAEDLAVDQAVEALVAIGAPDAVTPLLQDARPAVRVRAAETLARIGREEAMPGLASALSREPSRLTAAALARALAHLESQPPPPLRVKLMGDFALWRGEQPVPASAWFRPIVRKLFQYFALHRGEPLSRDRILEDLWPGLPPDQGRAALRTTYSRLRQTLDPYLRAKVPARYFAVSSETYRFDPKGAVQVDIEDFQSAVRQALAASGNDDMPTLSPALMQTLEQWTPLLPELPLEDWLLETRERLHTYYVEGCLLAAQSFLARGQPAEALPWARRAVETAPWLEQGYQMLMRAYARQGQRASALKTFQQATIALQRELSVKPSPLTRWLAERLQNGEDI